MSISMETLALAKRYARSCVEDYSEGNANIFYDTMAHWDEQASLVGVRGAVYITSDYDSEMLNGEIVYIPGLRIGDGETLLKDLPYFLVHTTMGDVNTASVVTDTVSGEYATIKDAAGGVPIMDITAYIKAVQSGSRDPSPNNVRTISGWTGCSLIHGLANYADQMSFVSGYYNDSGVEAESLNVHREPEYIPVVPGQKYVIRGRSSTNTSNRVRVHEYNSSKTWLRQKVSYSCPAGESYQNIWVASNDAAYIRISVPTFVIQPFISECTVTDISWQSEAGTVYGGTLNIATGELTVTHGIETYDGSPDEQWNIYSTHGFYISNSNMMSGSLQEGLCNIAPNVFGTGIYGMLLGLNNTNVYFPQSFTIWGVSSVEDLRTWLSAHNIVYTYPLATPQTYTLTPIEVKTILGENCIWVDAGDISVNYRADTGLYVDKRLAEVQTLRESIAPVEDGVIAKQPYAKGKYFFRNGSFCKAKAAISSGASFTLNSNYEVTTVAAELYAANNS